MANLVGWMRCLTGFHDWRLSRFVALGQIGPSYVCKRCAKHWEPGND
ncbi:hypothetical protein BHE75_01945 [Sphingomonas haloaromaticamans]|uniref:Uncharacterized protein n=1 Tax=Edaphosphingomonas haloaromaticamans TaxID=653954 RepID=A0A1S1HDT2_9SPHN|nr:hypothetical protein BHE75_01945 [Sphingomonas haloaromaticamans]